MSTETTTTMSYQIVRTGDGKTRQWHYDRDSATWCRSESRFDGEFMATPEEARELYAAVVAGYRPNRGTSKPQLMVGA